MGEANPISRRWFCAVALGFVALAACTPSYAPTSATPFVAVSEGDMLAEVNAVRKANGQKPLSFNATLARAARAQAQLMAERDTLSHQFGPGTSLRDRVTRVGYDGPVGENLAGGQRTLEGALQGWMQSSGHRTTLLSGNWSSFGMAVVPGKVGGRYGVYWAAIFGG